MSFSYEADHPVLQGVSFRVEPETMTAIVGPSGCGKTTIARLIARFYDVDAGSVLVGERDVRDWETADLMAQLSLVFQDVYLFDDTLEANVRVGNPDATRADIEEAARLSGVERNRRAPAARLEHPRRRRQAEPCPAANASASPSPARS